MKISFDDKIVLVTGGSRGLGRTLVEAFLENGASVVTCARHPDELETTVGALRERFGDRVTGWVADIRHADAMEQLVHVAQEHFGGLDILVNNAAFSHSGTGLSLTDEQWEDEWQMKSMAVVRGTRAAVPALRTRGGGSIITISAVFDKQPDARFYASSVVRAGVLGLTKLLARELAPDHIRVNAIGAGLIHTPSWEKRHDPATGSLERYLQETARAYDVAMQRLAEPEEVANAVLFLASDAASYITGTQLDVDGGLARYL